MKTSGNKRYTIKYLKHVLKRNLPSLSEDVKPSIREAIKEYLETDPIGNGMLICKKLKGHIRLSKEYNLLTTSNENFIYLAMTRVIIKRYFP